MKKGMPEEVKKLQTATDYYKYWDKYGLDVQYVIKNTMYFLDVPLKETEKAILIEYAKTDDCKYLSKKWVAKSICKELSADGYHYARDEENKHYNKVYAVPSWAIWG